MVTQLPLDGAVQARHQGDAVASGTGRGNLAAGTASTAATPGEPGPAQRTARSRRTDQPSRVRRIALGGLVPVGLLGLWQVVTAAGIFRPHQLPAPVSVWAAGVDLWQRGLLTQHVAISTQRVLIGFALGASLGLVVGAIVGLSRLADTVLAPTVGAVRAVPSLAWVPLLLLWLGIGEGSKVVLIAIGAFFPVYTTVAAALRHTDQHLVEVGRAYGLRGVELLGRIQLPAATPSVVAGLRLALAQSWLFLVAAELLASSMGLGFILTESQNNGRTDRLLLAIVLLALLGKLTDAVIGIAERRLLERWA